MTLEELRKNHRQAILDITAEYGISNIRIFGSVARGEATKDSDVDMLVHLDKPIGLKFVTLRNCLTDMLEHEVDLLSDNGISPYIEPYILEGAVVL